MMIKTYDLCIYFNGFSKEFLNISKTAVSYYINYYKENEKFYGYDIEIH